jgi:hypothetical protein
MNESAYASLLSLSGREWLPEGRRSNREQLAVQLGVVTSSARSSDWMKSRGLIGNTMTCAP